MTIEPGRCTDVFSVQMRSNGTDARHRRINLDYHDVGRAFDVFANRVPPGKYRGYLCHGDERVEFVAQTHSKYLHVPKPVVAPAGWRYGKRRPVREGTVLQGRLQYLGDTDEDVERILAQYAPWAAPEPNGPTFTEAYRRTLSEVLALGAESSPRGRPTRELLAHTISFDARYPVLRAPARDLCPRFMTAEAAWILGGDDRVTPLIKHAPSIGRFSDNGETFFGAYGPRVEAQLEYAVGALRHDRDTRQSIINIWRENPPVTKDYPCTLSYQFLIRNDRLHLLVTMRSNDVWLGLPYDAFNAAMLLGYVWLALDRRDLGLGRVYHTAGSRHLYDRNVDGARAVLTERSAVPVVEPFMPEAFGSPDELVQHLYELSERVATSGYLSRLPGLRREGT